MPHFDVYSNSGLKLYEQKGSPCLLINYGVEVSRAGGPTKKAVFRLPYLVYVARTDLLSDCSLKGSSSLRIRLFYTLLSPGYSSEINTFDTFHKPG